MFDYQSVPLWKRTVGAHPKLSGLYESAREHAGIIAGEIHRVLPDFTVHDVTHFDSLWYCADLLVGEEYPVTPMEGFLFGLSILVHDLGMALAAFPGGKEDLKKDPRWMDSLAMELRRESEGGPVTTAMLSQPPPTVEARVIAEMLRIVHSEQAPRLLSDPVHSADGGVFFILEDSNLRNNLAEVAGKIASSHRLPLSQICEFLPERLGLSRGYENAGLVEPWKLAFLLLLADEINLDSSRAPALLMALRNPQGESLNHWKFQSKLQRPELKNERVLFTSATSFSLGEVNAWWLCFDMLKKVDKLLSEADGIYLERHRPELRLRARGVHGIESPKLLSAHIPTRDWEPVDARLHINNVPTLVKRLGGKRLYGDDHLVPLRELIQNAIDAVCARRLMEGRSSDWGTINIRLANNAQSKFIEVQDNGVGMTPDLLTGPFLCFGESYWSGKQVCRDHPGLMGRGFRPTGEFGIGFYSVFSYADSVTVRSRARSGSGVTWILEFGGLSARPILLRAPLESELQEPGTCVRFYFNDTRLVRLLSADIYGLFPASPVTLNFEAENSIEVVVEGDDWKELPPSELLKRSETYFSNVRRLTLIKDKDGRCIGRIAINPLGDGVLVCGGAKLCRMDGISGILSGIPTTVTRNSGVPEMSWQQLADFATSQAPDLSSSDLSDVLVQPEVDTAAECCKGESRGLNLISPFGHFRQAFSTHILIRAVLRRQSRDA